MHLHIVKLKSGGQQLPALRQKRPKNSFNHEKVSILPKVIKTRVFTKITECSTATHLHYSKSKSRPKIQSQTKEQVRAYNIQPEKNNTC